MSDVIERICKDLYNYAEKKHFNGEVELANGILKAKCYIEDEKERYIELVKEPQEEPNIPLECVDGSCPMALSEEYVERGMDVVHSCAECQYQPQVQLIVRTEGEISNELVSNCDNCHSCTYEQCKKEAFPDDDLSDVCRKHKVDWILGKEYKAQVISFSKKEV